MKEGTKHQNESRKIIKMTLTEYNKELEDRGVVHVGPNYAGHNINLDGKNTLAIYVDNKGNRVSSFVDNGTLYTLFTNPCEQTIIYCTGETENKNDSMEFDSIEL